MNWVAIRRLRRVQNSDALKKQFSQASSQICQVLCVGGHPNNSRAGENQVVSSRHQVIAETEEMATEDAVGISSYMTKSPGFRGTLKQRYSDFIVHEISCNGTVIRLTSLDPPPDESPAETLPVPEKTDIGATSDDATIIGAEIPPSEDADTIDAFRILVGDEDTEQLKNLLKRIEEKESELTPVFLAPDSDKAHRAAVHNFFKSKFPFLVTDTVDGPGDVASSKCVRVRYFCDRRGGSGRSYGNKRDFEWKGRNSKRRKRGQSGDNDVPFDSRGKDDRMLQTQKFLLFHLFKENKNTQDALMVISRMLGVQPKSFGFAGTKDKRAVTTQQVTVFKQPAAKLASLNSRLFGIKVGNFSYVEKSLGLGELSGNQFTITLRNIVAECESVVAEAAKELNERGFVNYYGLQRFGNSAVATHTVGAALLRGEWKTAVDLVLQPRDGELPEIAKARSDFHKTRNVDRALQQFPRQLGSERALLGGLKKNPGNWLMAFNCIPRPMRLMFVHSYQSYLWNCAATYRLRTYSTEKVVEGDLVYCEAAEHQAASMNIASSLDNIQVIATDENEAGDDLDAPDPDGTSEYIRNVKLVTAEDVIAEKYTIADVVLPLPGSSILYPTNSTANIYQELATKDAVDLTSCSHSVKDYSIVCMTGGYRRVVQKLEDFHWKIVGYDDVTLPLSETDSDAIVNLQNQGENQSSSTNADTEPETTPVNAGNGLYKALQLHFTLPTSSYATMAIRELLKTSTSVAFHKTLNEEGEN
ncbi:unnamed protein product [Calypogeia fissa]